MEALALSEFYGFARLGFMPCDVTMYEEQLQKKYCMQHMRVPEFIAGNAMVEVKRLKLGFDVADIVRKACEKAHFELVENERIHIFYICYALPDDMKEAQVKQLQKSVKTYTVQYSGIVFVKKLNIVFTKVPSICFDF